MYDLLLPPSVKGLKDVLEIFKKQDEIKRLTSCVLCESCSGNFQKIPRKTFMAAFIFNIFANLQVDKYAEYCISSNKCWASNKHLPLISTVPNSFNKC